MSSEQLQVKVLLDDDSKVRFEKIKKHYGLRTDAETIRLLIKREYDRLHKK